MSFSRKVNYTSCKFLKKESDITLFGITPVKIILNFKPSLVDPCLIRNVLHPIQSYDLVLSFQVTSKAYPTILQLPFDTVRYICYCSFVSVEVQTIFHRFFAFLKHSPMRFIILFIYYWFVENSCNACFLSKIGLSRIVH